MKIEEQGDPQLRGVRGEAAELRESIEEVRRGMVG